MTRKEDQPNAEEETKSAAVELYELVNSYVRELFIDKHGRPFTAIEVNGHQEILPIQGTRFKRLILKFHYDDTGDSLRSETLNQVCDLFEAKASFDGNLRDLQLRASYDKESNIIYMDLTNKSWQMIKITTDDWSIEESTDMPITFTRYSNQIAQVEPSREYPDDIFDQFMNLLNVKSKDHKILLKCYMIALLLAHIPKPVLILHGEQGAAKSSCHEIIKDTIDPSILRTLVIPRDITELIQQLSHNYIAYYDNISYLKDWVSDQFCRAVTGSGSSKRELWTNDDDIIYQFMRGIGLNGINLAASKADLLDRSIIILLERIDPKKRRNIEEINRELQLLKPKLLGYICDILVKVLDVIANGGIRLETKSRMSDFEYHAEIISRCMGNEPNQFIEIYRENQRLQTDAVIEGSPVAIAIIRLMEDSVYKIHGWSGTATELLTALETVAYNLRMSTMIRQWPRGANALTRKLNEIKTNLRQNDISIDYERDGTKGMRVIKIRIISSEPSYRQYDEKSRSEPSKDAENTDDIDGSVGGISSVISSVKTAQKHAQNGVHDDMYDTDDILRLSVPSRYDVFLKAKVEFKMGFNENWSIKRLYGDTWGCGYNGSCSKIKSDRHNIFAHAINHELAEVRDKLGVLKGFDSDTRTQELRRMNMNQLQLLASHVEHNSTLEKAILEAIDYNRDGGRI